MNGKAYCWGIEHPHSACLSIPHSVQRTAMSRWSPLCGHILCQGTHVWSQMKRQDMPRASLFVCHFTISVVCSHYGECVAVPGMSLKHCFSLVPASSLCSDWLLTAPLCSDWEPAVEMSSSEECPFALLTWLKIGSVVQSNIPWEMDLHLFSQVLRWGMTGKLL